MQSTETPSASASGSAFAATPTPPYFAVIFASQRNDAGADGYAEAAARMLALAAQQPGYLGVELVRDGAGFGLTVSYWRDEAAILGWKHQMEHAAVRNRGRRDWYTRYITRVAKVERDYDWVRRDAGPG